MERRLIAVLSVTLIAALVVIAFQAGKLSVKTNGSIPQTAAVARPERPVETQRLEAPAPAPTLTPLPPPPVEQWPAPAGKEQLTPPQPALEAPRSYAPPPLPREERLDTPRRSTEAGPAAAIASYFSKIDAIHVEGTGDPTAFAQGIIGGIQNGDSSQMDKLVNDAKLALGQAAGIQPPQACAEYHQKLIEALSESVAGLEKFRSAIQTSDLGMITSVATQLQTAQKKINDLELMRKKLLGQ